MNKNEIPRDGEMSKRLEQSLEDIKSQPYIKIEAQNLTWSEQRDIRRLVTQIEEERGITRQKPLQYGLNFGTDQYVHIVNALAEESEKEE